MLFQQLVNRMCSHCLFPACWQVVNGLLTTCYKIVELNRLVASCCNNLLSSCNSTTCQQVGSDNLVATWWNNSIVTTCWQACYKPVANTSCWQVVRFLHVYTRLLLLINIYILHILSACLPYFLVRQIYFFIFLFSQAPLFIYCRHKIVCICCTRYASANFILMIRDHWTRLIRYKTSMNIFYFSGAGWFWSTKTYNGLCVRV